MSDLINSPALDLIEELERRAQNPIADNEQDDRVALLTFYLGEEWFAIPLAQVKVVSRMVDVAPVPGTSPYVLGVINYKSAIYPLVDIRELMNLATQLPTRLSRFVVINYHKIAVALLVDMMGEVREVPRGDLDSLYSGNRDVSAYIATELMVQDKLLGLLNLETILNAVSEGELTFDAG